MTWNDGDERRGTHKVESFYIPAQPLIELEDIDLESALKDKIKSIASALLDGATPPQAFAESGLEYKQINLERQIGKKEAKVFLEALPKYKETLACLRVKESLDEMLRWPWEEIEPWEADEKIKLLSAFKRGIRVGDSVHIARESVAVVKAAYASGKWSKSAVSGLLKDLRKLGAAFDIITWDPFDVGNSRYYQEQKNGNIP